MPIDALPTPPSRNDPANFAERGDAFLAALPGFVTQANALQLDVNEKQETASDAANTATTKASDAETAANTAIAKAVEASASAATATTKAGEASASANTATTKAAEAAGYAAAIDPSTLGASRVMGLAGNVNATTPLTKFDLSAHAVVMRNVSGATKSRYNTGILTCDLGLSGTTANGRDQPGAFSANSWIYLYFIWNGTTLATLASATAPASFTGSTLPTGYTHWAFATALRWNASSNIVPIFARGSSTFYDSALSNIRALSAGQATIMTAVSLAALVPPIATSAQINFGSVVTHNAASVDFSVTYRATGSAISGLLAVGLNSIVASVQAQAFSSIPVALGTSQQIDYKIAAVPSVGGGAYIDVLGFKVPNGDA